MIPAGVADSRPVSERICTALRRVGEYALASRGRYMPLARAFVVEASGRDRNAWPAGLPIPPAIAYIGESQVGPVLTWMWVAPSFRAAQGSGYSFILPFLMPQEIICGQIS